MYTSDNVILYSLSRLVHTVTVVRPLVVEMVYVLCCNLAKPKVNLGGIVRFWFPVLVMFLAVSLCIYFFV